MIRAFYTASLLAGAVSGCTKPNPLFLDTAGGVSDGGTEAGTVGSGSSTSTPTTTPTTDGPMTSVGATTSEPGTTSEPLTTAGPTSGTTGGQDFFCDPDPMSGCCAVEIPVEADNFFAEVQDVADPGCPLAPKPQQDPTMQCGDFSFGAVPELGIFNDFDGSGFFDTYKHFTFFGLRFPMADGLLLLEGVPIPWDVVTGVELQFGAKVRWDEFTDFSFGVHGLGSDQIWTESVGMPGALPLPCKDGNSSYFCLECSGVPGSACGIDWVDFSPVQDMSFLGQIATQQGADPDLLAFEGIPPAWLEGAPGGLVLVPFDAVTTGGQGIDFVPHGAIAAKARESGTAPRLMLTVCKP